MNRRPRGKRKGQKKELNELSGDTLIRNSGIVETRLSERHGMQRERNDQCLEKIGRKCSFFFFKKKSTMDQVEAMMIQSNERVLSSVSLQIQGMNTNHCENER